MLGALAFLAPASTVSRSAVAASAVVSPPLLCIASLRPNSLMLSVSVPQSVSPFSLPPSSPV